MCNKEFHKAVTIFIDILGTHGRSNFEDWYKITKIFNDTVKREKILDNNHEWTIYKREIHVFSDCAYIVYDYKDGVEENKKDINALITIACYNTEKVLYEFLKNGFIARGALTYGDIYYENDIWFGPAMNKACDLESKCALYPRVIIDPQYAKGAVEYNNKIYRDTLFKRIINGESIRMDKDGYYYIHYLNTMELGINRMEYNYVADRVLDLCEVEKNKEYSDKKLNESIKNKYNWLENYIESSMWKIKILKGDDIKGMSDKERLVLEGLGVLILQ